MNESLILVKIKEEVAKTACLDSLRTAKSPKFIVIIITPPIKLSAFRNSEHVDIQFPEHVQK